MSLSRALFAALFITLNLSAYAEVTVVRHFRLGESDAGAAHGSPAGATSGDLAKTEDLAVTGSPLYSADVANANSSLSMVFDGTTQYATTGNWNNLTMNFGVEVWVKPTSADGGHYVLYNGDSDANGWGIFQNPTTGKFEAHFGGRATFGMANAVPGVWIHLAIVCTDTVATFYVNGVAAGSTPNLPNPASGFLAIASNAKTPATDLFAGKIDEVRIFTFAPGAFSPWYLLFHGTGLPPSLHLKPLATQDKLIWPTWDRAFGLQTSTTLLPGSWTTIAPATETNGVLSVTRTSPGPTRFYRLIKPCGKIAPPRLPEGKLIVISTNNITKNVTTPSSQVGNRLFGNTSTRLDASAFIDPADCNGGADSLDFHWVISYPGSSLVPSPYSCQGITGYRNAVLNAAVNSMVNQPNPFTANGPGVQFLLTVTSRLTGLSTQVNIQAQVVTSALTLTIFNDCRQRVTVCVNNECACTIAAALPTAEPL